MSESLRKARLGALGFLVLAIPTAWSFTVAYRADDNDTDLDDFASFGVCLSGPDATPSPECDMEVDIDSDGDVDLGDYASFQLMFTGRRVPAPLPPKTITFDVIGIHDPNSPAYDTDCIECHGEQSETVALDGVTPTAHGRMVSEFGTGNDACLYCHGSGVDFISGSAVSLRKQIGIWDTECALCHIENGPPGAPRFYVRQ